MTNKDYYEILGIPRNASDRDIKQAYRQIAIRYHPDRNLGDKEAEEKFKEAAEAYEVLGKPEKREIYDRYGHEGLKGSVQSFSGFDDIFTSFGGIFEELFSFDSPFSQRTKRKSYASRGEDLRVDLKITFMEAAKGCEKTLPVQRDEDCPFCGGTGAPPGSQPNACRHCRGTGQISRHQGFFTISTVCPTCRGEGKTISEACRECKGHKRVRHKSEVTLRIPSGVDTGTRLRLSGEGGGGHKGGPPGDLYIFIEIEPHEYFRRQGDDLIAEVKISVSKAALGGKIEIPTLSGTEAIEMPPGIQSGDTHRLKKKGFPTLKGYGRGDEVVHFSVRIPTHLDKKAKELFQELERLGE
jgi:molecular chaperone DnaJ